MAFSTLFELLVNTFVSMFCFLKLARVFFAATQTLLFGNKGSKRYLNSLENVHCC